MLRARAAVVVATAVAKCFIVKQSGAAVLAVPARASSLEDIACELACVY